jgi:hypothetical protein
MRIVYRETTRDGTASHVITTHRLEGVKGGSSYKTPMAQRAGKKGPPAEADTNQEMNPVHGGKGTATLISPSLSLSLSSTRLSIWAFY